MSFSRYLQENLLVLLVYDNDRSRIIRNTVEPQLFGGLYKDIVVRIYDYLDQHKKAPQSHVADLLEDKLESKNKRERKTYRDILESIETAKEDINTEYVMTQLESFVKRQSLRTVAVDLAKALQRDTEDSLEEAERLISEAGSTSLKVFDPGLRMSNVEGVLQFLNNSNEAFMTGIPEFDKRGFGPTRKEMFLYIADTKTGKCVAEGECVLLADGSWLPIEKIKDGTEIVTINEDTLTPETSTTILTSNGMKPVYRVMTHTGRCVKLTKNHPLLTKEGWQRVEELEPGNEIACYQYGEEQAWFDKIEDIRYIGNVETYDLSVPRTHNFVCKDIVVHNTWSMIHLAKIVIMNNLKCVHISLEMSETKIAQRYVQTLFAVSKRDEIFTTTRFKVNKQGRVTFETKEVKPKLSLDDPKIEKKLRKKLNLWKHRALDKVIVKQFPTGKLTIGELEAYLDNLELTENFVPDLLIVDYPDLMHVPHGTQYRQALGDIYKRLRGVSVARNIALACPTQSNRAGATAKVVGRTNVSEAYSKIADADVAVTYSQTEDEKKLGLARLRVEAGRNDEDKLTVVLSQNYGTGQFAVDSILMDKDYWNRVGEESSDDDYDEDDDYDDD